MSNFDQIKFDYPRYYQMHALRHHGIIRGLAIFKWYWYGQVVTKEYAPSQPRTNAQQSQRWLLYEAAKNWGTFDSVTKRYYTVRARPYRLYGYHKYLQAYLRANVPMIIYWGDQQKDVGDALTPDAYMSSLRFQGAQRIYTVGAYPAAPPYGAIVQHSGWKRFFMFHEDIGWARIPVFANNEGLKVLIANNETDTGETTNDTNETTLFTISLPANNFRLILIEALVRAKNIYTTANHATFTWRIKYNGVTIRTFTQIVANPASRNTQLNQYLSYLYAGGQAAAANVTITGQMSAANAGIGILGNMVRLWGVY